MSSPGWIGSAVVTGFSLSFLILTLAGPKFIRAWGQSLSGGGGAGRRDSAARTTAAAAVAAIHERRCQKAVAEGKTLPEEPVLNEYELSIAAEIVDSTDLKVTFDGIAGLDGVKEQLLTSVVMPLTHTELFSHSSLLVPPRGVLFYGPPGTGKTLMAKALAKEVAFTFISVNLSSLVDMYLGESQKLGRAVFTLAEKLQPSIIFFDEVDALFGHRDDSTRSTHNAVLMMKSEMMALWDGMSTKRDSVVVVVGCTNRPDAIDPAFHRRMPLQFYFPTPDVTARKTLLEQVLGKERVAPDFDYNWAASATDGFSGSDLVEVCRKTVLAPVQDLVRKYHAANLTNGSEESEAKDPPTLRDATTTDFREAMRAIRPRSMMSSSSMSASGGAFPKPF